jgi:hypothetical protein
MGNTDIFLVKIDRVLKIILILAILIFVLEYLASMLDARVTHAIDAIGYYRFSKVPFFSIDFWLGMRPAGYPLFIKLLNSNPNLVIAVQSLFYLFTWTFFAFYLYARAQNKLFGLFGGVGLLVIVLHPSIAAWTHHVLTESLTFTFIAWIYMALYEFMISKNKKYLYYLVVLLVFYSTLRDVNAYYVISFVGIFGVLLFYKYLSKLNFITMSLILVASFVFSDYTANHSRNTITGKELTFQSEGKTIANRWVFPFMNIMGRTVLNHPTLFEYMKNEGMPVNEALLKQKNKWGGEGWYDNPDLQSFRDWVVKSGKSTYSKFLITHPGYTFGSIYQYRHPIFHYNIAESNWYYKDYLNGYKPDNLFEYSKITNLIIYKILLMLLGIIVFLSLVFRKNIWNANTIPMLILLLPIGLLAVVTYHGDAVDVFRHTLIVPFLVKITMVMVIYVLGNALWRRKDT